MPQRRIRAPLRLLACGLLLLVPPTAVAAEPGLYALDPVHTRVLFLIDHAGYSRALGTVSGSTGSLAFDPDDWRSARLEVTVPLNRLDLGDADWNTAAHDMLGAEDFPLAQFVSTRIEPVAADAARICGTLTLHGVSRDWCLDVQFNQLRRYPLPPFRRTAGFSASGHLQRSDFGIDRWAGLVGDTVELRIEAEAVYRGQADAPDAVPPIPP